MSPPVIVHPFRIIGFGPIPTPFKFLKVTFSNIDNFFIFANSIPPQFSLIACISMGFCFVPKAWIGLSLITVALCEKERVTPGEIKSVLPFGILIVSGTSYLPGFINK